MGRISCEGPGNGHFLVYTVDVTASSHKPSKNLRNTQLNFLCFHIDVLSVLKNMVLSSFSPHFLIIFSSCFLVFFQVFSNFPVMISLFHHIPMIFLSFFPLVHDFPIKFPTFPHDFPGVSPIPSPSVAPLRHRGEACRARTSRIC